MSRVFIISPSDRLNYADAERFGTLTYLFPSENEVPSPFNIREFERLVNKRLFDLNFSAEDDFFAISGPVIAVSIVLAMIHSVEPAKVLMWDAARRAYVDRQLETYGG